MTGANQKVGNWSGVTVEIKEGKLRYGYLQSTLVELPCTYSLSTSSPDEKVARDYIVDEKPDAVINVIDSTNLDRQLYFTLQLIELGIRPVLAFNMWDEVKSKGIKVDIPLMSKLLGLTIIPTNARSGRV